MKTVYNVSRELAMEAIYKWLRTADNLELEIVLETIWDYRVIFNVGDDYPNLETDIKYFLPVK